MEKVCSKGFPFEFRAKTDQSGKGYPLLARPEPLKPPYVDNTVRKECVQIRDRIIDNRWIVEHAPILNHYFNCHICVKKCDSIEAIKYVHKYIFKGYDSAMIDLIEESAGGRVLNYDEIAQHLNTRFVGPYEACWRLAKYEICELSHAVEILSVHLKGEHTVYYDEDASNEEILNAMEGGSKLLQFFAYNLSNRDNPDFVPLLYRDFPEHFKWDKGVWSERKGGKRTLGRLLSVLPSAGDAFYLRMLLQNVPGPTSHEDLLQKEDEIGEFHATFAKACEARGLIKNDQEYIDTMTEAVINNPTYAIRNLFVLILLHNNPTNAGILWDTFKLQMSDDFLLRCNGNVELAINRAWVKIARELMAHGKNIARDFPDLPQTSLDIIEQAEAEFHLAELENEVSQIRNGMNDGQRAVFDSVVSAIENRHLEAHKCFYMNGCGGTGKTHIYKAIYKYCMTKNIEVRTTAFSGIAATLLPKGVTNHKLFKLPVPVTETSLSLIQLGSPEAECLKTADVIIWDECSMSQRSILEACDKVLREIMHTNSPFGGKILLLGGDFRQVLPIKRRAHIDEIVDLCLNRSPLWKHFKTFKLTENMRANADAKQFAKDILDIGDGIANDEDNLVQLPQRVISKKSLQDDIFLDEIKQAIIKRDFSKLKDLVILAPKNKNVNTYNTLVLAMLPGHEKTYTSVDSASDWVVGPPIDPEILATYYDANFSLHKLTLKNGAIVILLRNLTIEKGLCNGTRLQVEHMGERVLKCKIITGDKKGKIILLPKITLTDTEHFPCELNRHQFPIKLAFAMSINKAQGQTFEKVGLDLTEDVFGHGQLYVALSRAHSWDDVKVALPRGNKNGKTMNVVWKEVFEEL